MVGFQSYSSSVAAPQAAGRVVAWNGADVRHSAETMFQIHSNTGRNQWVDLWKPGRLLSDECFRSRDPALPRRGRLESAKRSTIYTELSLTPDLRTEEFHYPFHRVNGISKDCRRLSQAVFGGFFDGYHESRIVDSPSCPLAILDELEGEFKKLESLSQSSVYLENLEILNPRSPKLEEGFHRDRGRNDYCPEDGLNEAHGRPDFAAAKSRPV